jgi:hypothetical protein
MIELPAERLQLATVTVEQKSPARSSHTRQDLPVIAPMLPRRKITLH